MALGNMCVDILLPAAPIPTPETLKTEATLAELTAASPPKALWEVGGEKERDAWVGGREAVHRPRFLQPHPSFPFPAGRLAIKPGSHHHHTAYQSPSEMIISRFVSQIQTSPARAHPRLLNRAWIDTPPTPSLLQGNCNFLIAAARLGLRAECAGHVGEDVYGEFLRDVLALEGVPLRGLVTTRAAAEAGRDVLRTLLCFVLSDGVGGHAFCSRWGSESGEGGGGGLPLASTILIQSTPVFLHPRFPGTCI